MKFAVILALCFPLTLQAEVSMIEAVENSTQVSLPSDVLGVSDWSLRTYSVYAAGVDNWTTAHILASTLHPSRQEGGVFRTDIVVIPGETLFTMTLRDRTQVGLDQFYVVEGPLVGVPSHLHCHQRTIRGRTAAYCPAFDNYIVMD